MRRSERPREGEKGTRLDRAEKIRPQGFVVELGESRAFAVARERALRRLDALRLPPDVTAARYRDIPAKGLTALRLADKAVGGGGRHSHVERGEGE